MKEAIENRKSFNIPKPNINVDCKQPRIPVDQKKILELRQRNEEELIFSFRFFDRSIEAFNLGGLCISWYLALIDILKEVSNLTRHELVVVQRNHYEAHKHDWNKLNYRFNFDAEFLEQVECLQFRLSKSKGRVHGFIIGNRFHIVWLDPHHNLYPDEKHGGYKSYPMPKTCYEVLEDYNRELQEKVIALEQENKKIWAEFEELMNEA